MSNEQDAVKIKLQYNRLRGAYSLNKDGYDPVAFLNLAATLRIFTEMPERIDTLYSPKIPSAKFDTGMWSIFRGTEHVYFRLPEDGVTVKANVGHGGTIDFSGPNKHSFSSGGLIDIEPDQGVVIKEFFMIKKVLLPEEVRRLGVFSKTMSSEMLNMTKYLNSFAIRFHFVNEKVKYISRTDLIRRIANEYGASHSNLADKTDSYVNPFSKPVERLMQYSCFDLPLPYFVLMHISKNILASLEEKM